MYAALVSVTIDAGKEAEAKQVLTEQVVPMVKGSAVPGRPGDGPQCVVFLDALRGPCYRSARTGFREEATHLHRVAVHGRAGLGLGASEHGDDWGGCPGRHDGQKPIRSLSRRTCCESRRRGKRRRPRLAAGYW